jgi:tRNA(fMet)-specific endonuclease VapC
MQGALGDLAVDSNAAVDYLRGKSTARQWLHAADALFLPVIVVGELRYGALHSQNPSLGLARVQAFADLCVVLDVTTSTAQRYGQLRQALSLGGAPIPEADLWIAAVCLEYGLPLLSDDAHFDRAPDLVRYDWKRPLPPEPSAK